MQLIREACNLFFCLLHTKCFRYSDIWEVQNSLNGLERAVSWEFCTFLGTLSPFLALLGPFRAIFFTRKMSQNNPFCVWVEHNLGKNQRQFLVLLYRLNFGALYFCCFSSGNALLRPQKTLEENRKMKSAKIQTVQLYEELLFILACFEFSRAFLSIVWVL